MYRRGNNSWAGPEHGATLLELLASVSVISVVLATLTGLFWAQIGEQKNLQAFTNLYEDLRIPAQILQQDARLAVWIDTCGRHSLTITTSLSGDSVEYRFGTGADAKNLHRVETIGGQVTDEVIGWNLVPPSEYVPRSTKTFSCTTIDLQNYIDMHLEKFPVKPGGRNVVFETKVFLRNN